MRFEHIGDNGGNGNLIAEKDIDDRLKVRFDLENFRLVKEERVDDALKHFKML